MATSKKLAKLLYKLGKLYYFGKEVAQNYNEAFCYFKKAANQNYAPAQNKLGIMYFNGYGVKQNNIKAFKWFYKAANQGNDEAQLYLGIMYEEEDYIDEAIEWYQKSANQGNDEAQYYLGMIYYNGDVIYDGAYTSDKKRAFYWFTKSANQGNLDAKKQLEYMYSLGEGLETLEDEYIINKYKEVIEQGNDEALCSLYHFFYDQYDYDEAISLLKKAADKNCIFAMNELGDIYYYGDVDDINYEEAFKWYRKSADLGDEYAEKQLKLLDDKVNKKNI